MKTLHIFWMALAAVGAGFFYNGKCKGLSKSAHDLAEVLEKNEPVVLKKTKLKKWVFY